ncbi:glyoxalase [Mycolicibacterium hodleri]|uniref:Glyoxalase n=1 Tax=Mycolicibacterium hodleri TaxID=49897 RepID=A0A502EG24_9MYCO|nr:glyoxalase [Mycolicibacterium hodleri]TPG35942.1 glyoxalase [Mycolicibacterium hodleri]
MVTWSWPRLGTVLLTAGMLITGACGTAPSAAPPANSTSNTPAIAAQAVGPQYDSVHVYVAPDRFDDFVHSWLATFGGTTKPASVVDVTPTASRTRSQLILSPVGTLSVFGYVTPTPYPFGSERTGWLLRDFDAGVKQARDSGAVLQVAPFDDPIGRDAIVEFPGGVNTQLYWHTTVPSYPALQTIPDNRVYLSPDAVDAFLSSYLRFTGGVVAADDPKTDGAVIGKPGTTFRQIHVTSPYGNTVVSVSDGHLPYPFGRETAGYAVGDVAETVGKATAAGAVVLVPRGRVGGGDSAVLEFPGGYVAEVHRSA